MSWASDIKDALTVARELLKRVPEIREGLELLAELRVRQGRDAEAGDLRDSIAKLDSLDRRKG